MKFKNKVFAFTAVAALAMFAAFSLGFNPAPKTVSNSSIEKSDTTSKIKKYHFSTWEDGNRVHWKAVIQNDEITSLYKNDKKLSDSEISKYKDMVWDKVGDYNFDFDNFDVNIPDIKIDFDSDKFSHDMEKMKEKLKDMKIRNFDFQFDKEKFRKEMKKMHKDLEKLKDCDFFDGDAFEKSMDRVAENLANLPTDIHVNIDADAIAKSMENVKIHMKDLKIDMGKLREKMKQLKGFLKDMKSELIDDGYLENDDANFELTFTKDKMIVNGKRLPDNLLEKYKEMYKEHFGKELDDTFRIRN